MMTSQAAAERKTDTRNVDINKELEKLGAKYNEEKKGLFTVVPLVIVEAMLNKWYREQKMLTESRLSAEDFAQRGGAKIEVAKWLPLTTLFDFVTKGQTEPITWIESKVARNLKFKHMDGAFVEGGVGATKTTTDISSALRRSVFID